MIQREQEERTFVVFAIVGYHLALPIEIVLQVVNCPAIAQDELSKIGLLRIGQHLIQVVNLHRGPDIDSVESSRKSQNFLIVIAGIEKKLYGILVHEPPNLMKLPLNKVQCLPPMERQFPLLNRVSHVIMRDQAESPTAIFLLDRDKF